MSKIRGGFGANMLANQINNMIPPDKDHIENNNALSGDGGDGVEIPQEQKLENRPSGESEDGIGVNVELSGDGSNKEQIPQEQVPDEPSQEEIQAELSQLKADEERLRGQLEDNVIQAQEDNAQEIQQRLQKLGITSGTSLKEPSAPRRIPRRTDRMKVAPPAEQKLPEIPLPPANFEQPVAQESTPQRPPRTEVEQGFDQEMIAAQLNNIPLGRKVDKLEESEADIQAAMEQELGNLGSIGSSETPPNDFTPDDTLELLNSMDATEVGSLEDDTEPSTPVSEPSFEATQRAINAMEADNELFNDDDPTDPVTPVDDLKIDPADLRGRNIKA